MAVDLERSLPAENIVAGGFEHLISRGSALPLQNRGKADAQKDLWTNPAS